MAQQSAKKPVVIKVPLSMRSKSVSMSLESCKTIFEIGGIVLLFLTFVSGVGAYYFSTLINARQKIELRNFTLQVANLQKDASDARANQQKVEIELAEQQERTAEAEKALLELREHMKSRNFSPGQEKQLVKMLTEIEPKGTISVFCVIGDESGLELANQITRIFKTSGWDAEGSPNQGFFSGGNPVGFSIRIHSVATAPAFANKIQMSFSAIGAPLLGFERPELAEHDVQIVIGNRPNLK